MSAVVDRILEFVDYAKRLKGDEKGEAQVFCDRLFQGFGHKGYKEAGAELEFRIKKSNTRSTSFADLVWKPRLLIEMKKAGEQLHLHQRQAFDYWLNAVPNRPRYVVLCNFNEFWVYDFDKQLDQPVDMLRLEDLAHRYDALAFLFPDNREPKFGNDREAVSRDAAAKIASVFHSLVKRDTPRPTAQRFVLQLVVAMFSEDIDLLPTNTISRIVDDCRVRGQNSYDLFAGLFTQMNTKKSATAGRFKGIPYFNGGLFSEIEAIELTSDELSLISNDDNEGAADKDWSKVNPVIFGTLFQQSMEKDERHAYGAHYTSEADILRIVGPTIVKPWEQRISSAETLKDLVQLRRELGQMRILDPACGSGNFLYVAYRELSRLETQLLAKIERVFSAKAFEQTAKTVCTISAKQFFGIERDSFGLELAKVTLMLARKLASDEAKLTLKRDQSEFNLDESQSLPLDNLDENFQCDDALFVDWPVTDCIIGNPPFQSKNKIQRELGRVYVNKIRAKYPDIPGRADYCVYWLRKTHDHLKPRQRAGLVGTNTIRQNYSREGGLDYIVTNGGEITEAVSSQVWSGDAVVHVSIVNWIKGSSSGKKRLYSQIGDNRDSPWEWRDLDRISSSLSFSIDVTTAQRLSVNAKSMTCYQGQTHGHEGFLIDAKEARDMIAADPSLAQILFPYITSDELLGATNHPVKRYVIDFGNVDQVVASRHRELFSRIEKRVLPDRKKAARDEQARNKEALNADEDADVNEDHQQALRQWWRLFRRRDEMLSVISALPRYIVCGRVTKRPVFSFIDPSIHPNDALAVFALSDDYSFGILQSLTHWSWFSARCSTLKSDPRYTSNTVFDTFPWPQHPTKKAIEGVAKAALEFRNRREKLMLENDLCLRDLYRGMEKGGDHPLKDAQDALDAAVRQAYGFRSKSDILSDLLELNRLLAGEEKRGIKIVGPGLPPSISDPRPFITSDCISMSQSESVSIEASSLERRSAS